MTDNKDNANLILEVAQKELNDKEIVDYFQTEIQKGRHAKAFLVANGDIFIEQKSFHVPGIKPISFHLTPETFSFMVEVFLHAEKTFNIDRKKNIENITDSTGEIKYKKTISI